MIGIKSPAEIEKMREAGRISAGALQRAGEVIRPGVSAQQVDMAVREYILKAGAKPNFLGYGGFPGSACVSVNDTVIHGLPDQDIILRDGDIVSIDTGALVDGWNGDNAYTFACGEVSEEAQRLLRATEEALYKGIEAALAGNRLGDVGWAVQAHAEAAGFSVVRAYVGHGIGRDMHEDPEVPNFGRAGRGPRLLPGMVLAIEPMVNQKGPEVRLLDDGWTVKTADGGLSAHFEHTVAITKDGPDILTRAG